MTQRIAMPRELHPDLSKAHTMQRAKERYGLDLTVEDIEFIVSRIQDGYGVPVEGYWKTKSRRVCDVMFGMVLMRVVYSRTLKTLITVLPYPEDMCSELGKQ